MIRRALNDVIGVALTLVVLFVLIFYWAISAPVEWLIKKLRRKKRSE